MADSAGTDADLVARLDRIANLMALTLVRGLEEGEQIRLLDAVGYAPAQIGAFLDKRPNTVSVTLTRQRQKMVMSKNPTARKKAEPKSGARRKKVPARRRRQ